MTQTARTSLRAAAGLMFVLAVGACSSTAKPQADDAGRQSAAQAVCRDAVQKELKTTTAAKFSQEKIEPTNYGFKFGGVVVADGAGAAAKNYVCSAEENGADWLAAEVSVK